MGEVYCLQENNIESKEQSKFSEFIADKKKLIICTASVLVMILASTMGYFFSIKSKVASWNNKIYSGISIYGVDLSEDLKCRDGKWYCYYELAKNELPSSVYGDSQPLRIEKCYRKHVD